MVILCSACGKQMPPDKEGHEIAVDWSVVRHEQHHRTQIAIGYLYLCPDCMIVPTRRQAALIPDLPSPESKDSTP